CREEMPSIERLRNSLKGQPFEVLAVNLAEPLSRIEKFVAQLPLGFPLLRDRDGAAGKAWRAKLLPASFLIGRDGRIRYVAYGEHADIARDARGEDRRADARRLRDHVRAALHHRADDEHMALRHPRERSRMRDAAVPAKARLARRPIARFPAEALVERLAD